MQSVYLRYGLHAQQVADFNAVVQCVPVDRKTARFNRPIGSLLWRSLGQPVEPWYTIQRQANLSPVVKRYAQLRAGETHTRCANFFSNSIS